MSTLLRTTAVFKNWALKLLKIMSTNDWFMTVTLLCDNTDNKDDMYGKNSVDDTSVSAIYRPVEDTAYHK